MTKVVLQPCGNGLPTKHYADTVERPVPLARMAPFIAKDELTDLRRMFRRGSAAVWGVTPGEQSASKRKWERMDIGDVLSGQVKSGQRWSGQNRPTDAARNLVSFNPFSPAQASPFLCASSVAHISGCGRDGAGGRAWR